MAIKDDIACYPYPTNGMYLQVIHQILFGKPTYLDLWKEGGTTWFHEGDEVETDAVSVSRLRSCGVILVGKANMHEFGLGTTGNNPNHG